MLIIFPFLIFYQALYGSYVRSGKSESDAAIYAPFALLILYMWFFVMLMKPISLGFAWVLGILNGVPVVEDDGVGKLAIMIATVCFMVAVKVNHKKTMGAVKLDRLPGFLIVLLAAITFSAPMTFVSVSYSELHYLRVLLFDFAYYMLWCGLLYWWRLPTKCKS